jgi:hypothetical protein
MKLRPCLLLPFAIAITTAPIVSISFPNLQPAFSASEQDKKDKPPTPAPTPSPPPPNCDPFYSPFDNCPVPPNPTKPKPKPKPKPGDLPGPIRRPS